VALVLWSAGLAACAACDTTTHRIPTPLVRRIGVAVAVIVAVTAVVNNDWNPLFVAAIASGGSFTLTMMGWRFAGIGRGDTRLAALGGLGLGWSSFHAVAIGLLAFCVLSLVQVGVTLAHGGNRHSMIAYGLPLCLGYLIAASAI
jgi:leader peptidase (prepilin peptidase)/N-methyltransferase